MPGLTAAAVRADPRKQRRSLTPRRRTAAHSRQRLAIATKNGAHRLRVMAVEAAGLLPCVVPVALSRFIATHVRGALQAGKSVVEVSDELWSAAFLLETIPSVLAILEASPVPGFKAESTGVARRRRAKSSSSSRRGMLARARRHEARLAARLTP